MFRLAPGTSEIETLADFTVLTREDIRTHLASLASGAHTHYIGIPYTRGVGMAKAKTGRGGRRAKKTGTPGRPRGAPARHRKQLVIDVSLLERAMAVTGCNQSDTVNEALARLTENAAIVEGFEQMRGAFPEHPDHPDRATR